MCQRRAFSPLRLPWAIRSFGLQPAVLTVVVCSVPAAPQAERQTIVVYGVPAVPQASRYWTVRPVLAAPQASLCALKGQPTHSPGQAKRHPGFYVDVVHVRPVRAKALIFNTTNAAALTGRTGKSVHLYPGCCPGLCVTALSGRPRCTSRKNVSSVQRPRCTIKALVCCSSVRRPHRNY